jgi:hypothetical protein
VNDVDECKYDGHRAMFRHRCSSEARCVNTIGSYTCACKPGYNGTGFTDPVTGKSGCVDVRPPVLTCADRGCLPMSFRAVSVVGIMSIDVGTSDFLKEINENSDYQFVQTFLQKNKQSLCPLSDPCYKAYDETHLGVVDLTSRIQMNDVVLINASDRVIIFSVPYSVEDDAGCQHSSSPLNECSCRKYRWASQPHSPCGAHGCQGLLEWRRYLIAKTTVSSPPPLPSPLLPSLHDSWLILPSADISVCMSSWLLSLSSS